MKTLLYISLLMIVSSCCPKVGIETSQTIRTDTVHDTVTVIVPIEVPAKESAPIEINLTTLCDSLYKGQLKPQERTSEIKRANVRQIIGTVVIDTNAVLRLTCKEDAYKDTIRDLKVVNTLLRTEINNRTVQTIERPFYLDLWFWVAVCFGLLNIIQFKRK